MSTRAGGDLSRRARGVLTTGSCCGVHEDEEDVFPEFAVLILLG